MMDSMRMVDVLRMELATAEDALHATADAIEELPWRVRRRVRKKSRRLTPEVLRRKAMDAHKVLMATAPAVGTSRRWAPEEEPEGARNGG